MKRIKQFLGLGAGGAGAKPAVRLLMVCSGNICRSPTAEAVLRAKLVAARLDGMVAVDSAGTAGFHVKEPPDPRAQEHARRRGYDLSRLRARRVVDVDFDRFDWMFAMDQGHLDWLRDAAPVTGGARMALLMDHAIRFRDRREVPDPYFGAPQAFEQVLDLVEDACDGLVQDLLRHGGGGLDAGGRKA